MGDAGSIETREWAATHFGIPITEVLWYNAGICYDRIAVKTKRSAKKVSQKVQSRVVNGGWFDGMALGVVSQHDEAGRKHYVVMC